MINLNEELRSAINNYNSLGVVKVFVSNINIDSTKNIDTTLYQDISDTQGRIQINGNYDGYKGYLAIDHEIIKVNATYYNGAGGFTICVSERGMEKTKPQSHSKDSIIRSVELLRTSTSDSLDFNIKKESEVAQNQLFQPVLTNSSLTIYEEDTSKWVTFSDSKQYLVRQNKYVYIYIGYGEYCVRETTGYITDFYTSSKDQQVVINFTSKLNLWYDKNIDYIKTYKNLDLRTFFSSLLGLPLDSVKYAEYNQSSDFSKIDYVTLKDYDNYGDLIVEVCKSKNIRINFDALENLIISTTVKKESINNYISTAENIDVGIRNLTDIDANTENTMIFNNINCNFLKRKALKNRNDFIINSSDWILAEGVWNDLGLWKDYAVWYDTTKEAIAGRGQLKYIRNFNATITNATILSNDGSWKEFDIIVSNDVKYFQIGSLLIIQDKITGFEFRVSVTNKTENIITCIGGFDKDKEIDYVGKIDHLISQGFNTDRQFSVYYNLIEMPYVWALNIDDISDSLKIPILPNEEISYSAQYGTAELADVDFSGIVEENDIIFGTFNNSQLKYNRDFAQQIPVYLQTNKLKIEGEGQEQISKYSSFDNSNIELTVSYDETGRNDFNISIKNTMSGSYSVHSPLKTQLRVLTVLNIGNYNVGDVLVLDNSNEGKTYYNDLKNEKWKITAKFIDEDSLDNYIVVDKNYPTEEIGSTNSYHNYTFKRYNYNTIIHLNELRVRGNPVLEATEPYNAKNQLSIENYGQKDFEISGDIANIDDVKLLFNSLKNEYSGLDAESSPIIIPFSTTHRFDFEVGDLVRITDSVVTKLNNRIGIIISKNYYSSNLLEFNYDALLISSYEPYPEDVNLTQVIEYKPVSFATYDPIPNSDINSTGQETGNSIITVTSDNFGYITALKIDRSAYKGTTKNKSSDVTNSIELQVQGDLSAYNIPLLYLNKLCILQINNEFILVRGTEEINTTTENTTVNILERDLFENGETQISYNQDITMYKILSIQSEDGNYFTDTIIGDKDLGYYMQWGNNSLTIQGELQVGGDKGKITFTDSGLEIDDNLKSFPSEKGFAIRNTNFEDLSSDILFLKSGDGRIGKFTYPYSMVGFDVRDSITKYTKLDIMSETYPLSIIAESVANFGTIFNIASDNFSTDYFGIIRLHGLQITDSTNISYGSYQLTGREGLLSYHDNHFWGYSNGWKQLDGGGGTSYERRINTYGSLLDLRLESNKNVVLVFTDNAITYLPDLPDERIEIKVIYTNSWAGGDAVVQTTDGSFIYEEGEVTPVTQKFISNYLECYSFINDGTKWYAMKVNFSM